MKPRTLATLVPGLPTADGNGVPLRRIFPNHLFSLLDPFLLLDHFGPLVLPPGSDVGFPPHPHRGFQTLTYLVQGAFAHRDSTGGKGLLRPGGAQLMTAGSGIVHEELPVPEHLETGGAIEGLQLWINLPQALKGSAPGYRDLQPDTMPWQTLAGGRLRALAGDWLGVRGPAETPAAIAYAHVELEADAAFEHALPDGWNAAVYVLHGEVELGGGKVGEGKMGVFTLEGEGLALRTNTAASFIILAGRPLNEPIARGGPFVMNTEAEIRQAFADYRAGRMGFLD
jgi:hypothetical protein